MRQPVTRGDADGLAIRGAVAPLGGAGAVPSGIAETRAVAAGGVPRTAGRSAPAIRRAPPATLEVFAVGKGATVAEVLRLALVRSANRLLSEDPRVRHARDPEAVHQARVSTRRLRSALRTYARVLSPDWTDSLRQELGWLGTLLGQARDLDVLREHMSRLAGTLPERDRLPAAALLIQIERRREAARAELLGAMQQERYATLLERVASAASAPKTTRRAERPAVEALPSLMVPPWNALRRSMRTLGPDSPDAELHAARIRAKRARYAAESMRPIFGDRARAFADAAAELQGVLGDYRDAVVAERWLRSSPTIGVDTGVCFAAGSLAALARQEADRQRSAWPRAWKRLRRKKLRFWT
jgi:CHAD domain-containing protein